MFHYELRLSLPRQIAIIISQIRAFFHWWIAELAELVPKQHDSERKTRPSVLQIRRNKLGYAVDHFDGTNTITLAQDADSPAALSAAIEKLKSKRASLKKLPIRYVLDQGEFMVWNKTRPRSAAGRLTKLARFDALAAIPLGDAQISVIVDRLKTEGDQIHTREYIAKTDKLENICKVFLDAGLSIGELAPPDTSLNFLGTGSDRPGSSFPQPLRWALAISASLALIIAGLWGRQAQILDRLEAQNSILETNITNLRTGGAAALQARYEAYQLISDRRKNTSSTVENLEKLSALIPDTAWVSEWESSRDQIRIVGFAEEAAPLVETIETHPDFESVRLTSPISLDTTRNIEKFTLEMTPLDPGRDTGDRP